uniref:Capsid protein n=1 Tax=Torque teno Leptonychotes weddellii virus-1 TaxID=2012676 RepID=A0A1Z2RVD1_9VIRU|nr:ORF1 [Torque teno Leptonychotes weddellii virus 1]ASA49037.1 ORF1 [Torque teno Leptonychotes weddellii virus 1]
MAIYRRKRIRRYRRPRWRGRRKHLYWRRKHYRRHYGRRRRYPRQRTASVRYYPSRRRKRISVRGWEPLGNICAQDSAESEATPYKDLDVEDNNIFENDSEGNGQWHGQWGHHFFTFRSLLMRSKYYFNYWSGDWEGYDYLSFLGGWIWLPRMPSFSWMFYLDNSIQSDPKEDGPEEKYKNEKSWVHPGILLNRPGSKLMISTFQYKHGSFFRKLRVRPPASWEGNYRMDVGKDFLLFHWSWTTVNLTASFFDFFCQKKRVAQHTPDTCIAAPWFMGEKALFNKIQSGSEIQCKKNSRQLQQNLALDKADTRSAWVNRKLYVKSDCEGRNDLEKCPPNFHNWGPFLPQNVLLDYSFGNSVYFRYKLFFKVSGDSLYRRLPNQPCSKSTIPPCPGYTNPSCRPLQAHSILKKKRRPPSIYDILPGDLDESGILTERAYRRITGSSGPDQPTAMVTVPHRRVSTRKRVRFIEPDGVCKRKRARQLIRLLLGGRGEPGGGRPPPNPPPITEPLDLLLNFPK